MRRESLFFGILTLVVSAFLTGCSDDDTEVYVPQRVAEFNLSDESDGNRLFIIHPWEGEIAIPVHDDRIRDFEFSGKYFDWEMRQGAESRFLMLNLKKEVERKPFLEKIALRGIASKSGEAATDTLFLVSQPKLESSASDNAPSYMHNVGKTVNTAGDIFAAPSEPFLDFDLMYGTEAFVKTPHAESWGRERSGVDYEEMVDNMWQELGISVSSLGFTNQGAPTPTRSKLFSGSFDQRFQHNQTSSNRFEYHVDVHVKPMVELHMATAIYTSASDPDVFLPFLTTTASRLLNETNSDLYKRYGNTQKGIYDLYDTYGTHVLVGGVFGGSYTYIYSRKENLYYDETVFAAEAELSAKSSSPAGENENWLQTYYRVMGTHGGKIGAEVGAERAYVRGEHHDHHRRQRFRGLRELGQVHRRREQQPPPRKLRPEGRYHPLLPGPPVLPDEELCAARCAEEISGLLRGGAFEAGQETAADPGRLHDAYREGQSRGSRRTTCLHRAGRQGTHLQSVGAEYQGTERLADRQDARYLGPRVPRRGG